MAELDEYLTADEGEEDRVDHFADFKRSNSLNKAAIFRKFLFQKQISSKRGHKKPKKIRNRFGSSRSLMAAMPRKNSSSVSLCSLASSAASSSAAASAQSPTMASSTQTRKPKTSFSLRRLSSKAQHQYKDVSDGLRTNYHKVLRPFEEASHFHAFVSPALEDADFDSKPMVMLVGQYSTGKTTFIRYLLEEDFPGMRIGPEPTTDKWNVVMSGQEEGIVPGNALAVDPKLQFRPLAKFGNTFMNRLQCSHLTASVLDKLSLIDTPGVLSGQKQSLDRGYDYIAVLQWFAARVDRVLVMFDANKLDISDEFRRVIQALKAHDDKIRIVLNKSDQVTPQQLMRVYGALMWSLGKVFETPEVVRVYIGSFWDRPFVNDECGAIFNSEMTDLLTDLKDLNRHAALRKLNDFIKRARAVKIQALVLSELSKKMPSMFGKERKKKELMEKLDTIFKQVQDEYEVSPGDFPKLSHMKAKLEIADWSTFKVVEKAQLQKIDRLLCEDLTKMMHVLPGGPNASFPVVDKDLTGFLCAGGSADMDAASNEKTPFKSQNSIQSDWHWREKHKSGWIVSNDPSYPNWLKAFKSLASDAEGKILGPVARQELQKSRLPNPTLARIWALVDFDEDGLLNEDEFCLAQYLIARKIEGMSLPKVLPEFLYPPK